MLPKKFFATKKQLAAAYKKHGSMWKVAKHFGVSKKLILNYMNKYGIERNQRRRTESYREELEGLIAKGLNGEQIGDEMGISGTYVYMLAKEFGFQIVDNYHKGFRISHNGYRLIRIPGHSESDKAGYVKEHRVIAEKMIGRRLLENEVVHHKNGDKLDNREENLEVMMKADHTSKHHTGKKWVGPVNGKRKTIMAKI